MPDKTIQSIQYQLPLPNSVDTPQLLGIGSIALAVIGFLGAWAFNQITHSWKEDLMELRTSIAELKSNNESYVRRDDYIRGMDSIDKKLDSMALRQEDQFRLLLNRLISRTDCDNR